MAFSWLLTAGSQEPWPWSSLRGPCRVEAWWRRGRSRQEAGHVQVPRADRKSRQLGVRCQEELTGSGRGDSGGGRGPR